MKKGLFILLLCISHNIFSQDVSQKVLQEYEDTLSTIAHTIMHGENEKVRHMTMQNTLNKHETCIL